MTPSIDSAFDSGDWSGELLSRAVSAEGDVAAEPDWSASESLALQIADDSREILTWKPSSGTGIAFRWPSDPAAPSDAELDTAQSDALSRDPVLGESDALGATRLAHLRGEARSGLRERERPLGDIVHSSPQLVGPPAYRYPDLWGDGAPENDHPYSDFAKTHAARPRVVYVGANDGMLHAFDAGRLVDGEWSAGTGEELFAYVPGPLYGSLPELTRPGYTHRYYVDATPQIGDALLDGAWRTVLVGGLGRGGQGVYALDVSDPDAVGEDSAAESVLWEFTDADDADLGYTLDSPLIARTNDGRWSAILSSGYNSAATDGSIGDGSAHLFVLDLESGTPKAKIAIALEPDGTPNALAAPTAADLDGDGSVDIVYAGDLKGNLWKFDLSDSDPEWWQPVEAEPMFTAVDDAGRVQPITTAVAVGRHPSGEGTLVYAGTGKYLETSDQAVDDTRHRLYALWDEEPLEDADALRHAFEDGDLLAQSITGEREFAYDSDGNGVEDSAASLRESTQHSIDWDTHRGWYVDLTAASHFGEQIITAPQLREDRVIVSTHLPSGDPCEPEQEGWLMLLDAASGAMPATALDVDGDGRFSGDERLSGIASVGNPFAATTIVSAVAEDVILSSAVSGSGPEGTTLDARTPIGRVRWRELAP